MPNEVNAEVLRRLRSADGHLHAIIGMVVENEACEEILHQLDAVQAALRAVSFVILEAQLQQSTAIIKNSDCAEDRSVEVSRMDELYQLFYKNK
jgi:DNA-binding FrmR family transcriptional regulator